LALLDKIFATGVYQRLLHGGRDYQKRSGRETSGNRGYLGINSNPSTVATPSISLAAGAYQGLQTTTISCATPGADIYYTTGGDLDTTNGTLYDGEITLPMGSTTLTAGARKLGMNYSALASSAYSITPGDIAIYTQDFSATYPVGWTKTYTGSGNDWEYYNTGYAFNGSYCMGYASNEYAANAWVFMQGISMTAGYTYRLEFYQRVLPNTPNNLKITIGTAQTIAAQTTVLLDSLNLVNTVYLNRVSSNFTPTVTGTYNFAFNCYSSPQAGLLLVDNVRVYETVPPPKSSSLNNYSP